MLIAPYLSFNGDCESAFNFYAQCLGGKLGALFRYAGSPMADQVPAGWSDKIMHGSVTVAGQELMGADSVSDRYQAPQGFTLSIQLQSTVEAERVFAELEQ